MTTKRCTGRCGRELPADAEHFHRHRSNRDGLNSRCRECRNDESYERRNGRPRGARSTPAVVEELPPPPSPDDEALSAALDAIDELIAELTGGRRPFPVTFQTAEGRRNFIRNYIASAPPGGAAEAAARARRIMAAAREAADRDVALPDVGALAAALIRDESEEAARTDA